MEHEQAMEQQIRDLAAALESVIAAILVGDRDADTARRLLITARDMAAAIRTGEEMPPGSVRDRHDA